MTNYEKEVGLYSVEKPDEQVIQNNINKLKVDMIRLLMTESLGGNAGTVQIDGKEYTCAGANGFANRETGEILIFENYQNVPAEIRESAEPFLLKVAIVGKDLSPVNPRNNNPKVVNFLNKENFSKIGKQAIEEAIDQFNEI